MARQRSSLRFNRRKTKSCSSILPNTFRRNGRITTFASLLVRQNRSLLNRRNQQHNRKCRPCNRRETINSYLRQFQRGKCLNLNTKPFLTNRRTPQARKMGINAEVTKNLLICVLWVLKNVERDSLSQWLGELTSSRLATLLHLLDACTSCFEYRPKQHPAPSSGYNMHAAPTQDVKSRLEDIILGQGSAREMMQRRKGAAGGNSEKLRWRKDQMAYRQSYDQHERHKESMLNDAYLEGHLSTEASFIILDTLERCVATVAQWDSQQSLVGLALSVLLHALGKNQSTTVLPHMFASQRSLVFKVRFQRKKKIIVF